jgi:type II secretory ATPase GspE/PulE/Tfp pilus assembly ATPase PilB-like protein
MKVDPLITPQASLEKAIGRYYGGPGKTGDNGDPAPSLAIDDEKEAKQLYLQSPPREGYSPLDWIRRFFLQTVKRRSREFHLEPREEGLRARYRIGDKLYEGEMAPVDLMRDITDRTLKLARMDGGGEGVPREGRLKILVRNRELIVELSSYQTLLGTRIVFRIMDEGLLGKGFQELGMSKSIADDLSRILKLKTGLLLLNAPPGGGKRTTFYNVLYHLSRDKSRNIMTMEHPIQYPVEGINQTQVSFGQGVDFYFGLKSLLHQNPDVVALSDISDCRTLELVFNAARRCLVIAMGGFNDNLQALEWISNCGSGRESLAKLLRGLLVQRVLPRNCNKCREQLDTPEELVEGVREKRREELVFYSGRGCNSCGQTGRSGKLGIFELLSLRFTLRDILARGGDVQVLYDEAQRQGMWTLREDGIMKATQGLVDVRDVLDATRDEGSDE